MVGLFSAGRGEEGGRMAVRELEDSEEDMPGGVRGVRGAELGREGLEVVSSVELRDSLRNGVYLVFGTSSILSFGDGERFSAAKRYYSVPRHPGPAGVRYFLPEVFGVAFLLSR